MEQRFSFEAIDAEHYARLRPQYPSDAVEWVVSAGGLRAGERVIDVGAGPGNLAQRLAASGLRVIGIEPALNMRRRLARDIGRSNVVAAYAEALPIRDGIADGVSIGHAAQWFGPDAVEEIHRILRPGGALITLYVWFVEDARTAELTRLMDRYQPPGWLDHFHSSDFDDALSADARFEQVGARSFPFVHTVTADDFATLASTASDVAALPDRDRRTLLAEIDAFAHRSLPMVYEWGASCKALVHRRTG